MNAIAIDDEPIALDIINAHAKKVPFINLTGTFTNAFEALAFLQQQPVDLLFLDIKMPDISGIDFLKTLNKSPLVVFTTAYSEHAVQGFELDAVDYLLKPFSLPRFLKACIKAKEIFDLRNQLGSKETDYFFVKDGYEQVKIFFSDIQFIEADGNYTKINLDSGKTIASRITINDLATQLPASFVRCHRAYIIPKNKVTKFDRTQLFIGEKTFPIGTTYADCMKN